MTTALVVCDKDSNTALGLYLNTHVINEYIESSDELETNGYVSYIDTDGHTRFKLMSEVLILQGEATDG